jgi:hypothetical protein
MPMEKLELLKAADLSLLKSYIREKLEDIVSHEVYIHGDVNEETAKEIHAAVTAAFRTVSKERDISAIKRESERIKTLAPEQHSVIALKPFNADDENNAYVIYFQVNHFIFHLKSSPISYD